MCIVGSTHALPTERFTHPVFSSPQAYQGGVQEPVEIYGKDEWLAYRRRDLGKLNQGNLVLRVNNTPEDSCLF